MSRQEIILNIGGKLETGDVVCVAYNNCNVFGWFFEGGQYGSLKFIGLKQVDAIVKDYSFFLNETNHSAYRLKRYANGLTFKSFYKDYILKFNQTDNRAFKISNPEEFFIGSDLETIYLKGKKVLNDMKFPAK